MLEGLQDIVISYPLFGVPEKTQRNGLLPLASGRDRISRRDYVAPLAEAGFLVGAASIAISRSDLTLSP